MVKGGQLAKSCCLREVKFNKFLKSTKNLDNCSKFKCFVTFHIKSLKSINCLSVFFLAGQVLLVKRDTGLMLLIMILIEMSHFWLNCMTFFGCTGPPKIKFILEFQHVQLF